MVLTCSEDSQWGEAVTTGEQRTHQVRAVFPMAGRLWLRLAEPPPGPGRRRGTSYKYTPLRSEAGAWERCDAERLAGEVERREASLLVQMVEVIPVGSDWPES